MSTRLSVNPTPPIWQFRPKFWQVSGVALLILYFFILNLTGGVAYRHLFLGVIICGLLMTGRDRARQFLIDWVPLFLFWIAYDLLRAIALKLLFRVEVHTPYDFDHFVFGWMLSGKVPAHWLTDWYKAHRSETMALGIFTACSILYTVHFVTFPIYMLVQWVNRRRDVFYKFSIAFALLHLVTVITYIVYPAAPPWWVYDYKFTVPTADYARLIADAPHGVLQSLWKVSPNYFAAVPSLHGAYPVMLTLLLWHKGWRWRAPLLVYAASVWFATLFLNHHFVFDLLVGAAFALGAVELTRRVIYPRWIEPRLQHEQKPAS